MPAPKPIHTERHRIFRSLLVESRKAAGLTQVQIAERLGKPPSYVAKVELGERRVDVLEFLDFTAAIGCDPVELLSKLRYLPPN